MKINVLLFRIRGFAAKLHRFYFAYFGIFAYFQLCIAYFKICMSYFLIFKHFIHFNKNFSTQFKKKTSSVTRNIEFNQMRAGANYFMILYVCIWSKANVYTRSSRWRIQANTREFNERVVYKFVFSSLTYHSGEYF